MKNQSEKRSCNTYGCGNEERTPFGGVCQSCAEKAHRRLIERRVRGFTAGGTDEQVTAIVDRIVLTGECVLHASAQVANKPCFCADCRPDVRRFA